MRLKMESADPDAHECQSHRKGDWIVYTCAHCPDYERRYHLKTGQMKVKPAADPTILHRGVSNNYDHAMIQRSLN